MLLFFFLKKIFLFNLFFFLFFFVARSFALTAGPTLLPLMKHDSSELEQICSEPSSRTEVFCLFISCVFIIYFEGRNYQNIRSIQLYVTTGTTRCWMLRKHQTKRQLVYNSWRNVDYSLYIIYLYEIDSLIYVHNLVTGSTELMLPTLTEASELLVL
jgi:hypothetical protein